MQGQSPPSGIKKTSTLPHPPLKRDPAEPTQGLTEMLLDSVEDIHAVLAVNHVYCQTPLAKAACAPNAVQVGLIVWVPVLVHRKVKIDDHRHLFNINTCTKGGRQETGVGGASATHTRWHWRHGWDRSHVAWATEEHTLKRAVAKTEGHNSKSGGIWKPSHHSQTAGFPSTQRDSIRPS